MEETLVILNPAARSARARNAWKKVGEFPKSATIHTTSAPGDARAIATWAVEKGFSTVVAAGGDGTINEVVNGIAGSQVKLGILPVGTMNVFAAELGLPMSAREAWKVIQAGHAREIDLALANRQYFVQLAGVGLDAQVVKETSWQAKRNLGPLSYVISAAQIMARKPPILRIQANGEEILGSFVLIGNGRFYGGPLPFFRDARFDDGLLDVLIFKNQSHLDIARYLAHILVGQQGRLGDVTYLQTKKLHVSSEADVPVEVDGELAAELPITFRIASKKLRVLVPQVKVPVAG
jgi:diacylglycerol kinase (ATP)